MQHKLKELFHDFANKVNAMNNTIAMTAITLLKKNLNALNDNEKADLIAKLADDFKKSKEAYQQSVHIYKKIIKDLESHGGIFGAIENLDNIMDIIDNAGNNNGKFYQDIIEYEPGKDFDSFIKKILNEALEFDKHMSLIACELDKIKDLLRTKGLYPEKNS